MSALVMPLMLGCLWPLAARTRAHRVARCADRAPRRSGKVPGIGAFFDTIVPTNIVAAASSDSFLPLTVFALTFAFRR